MNPSTKNVLTGDLKYLGLGDILQLIGANASTGVLKLSCRFAPHPALVYFKEGNPVDARCGDLGGLEALYPLFGWTEGAFEFTLNEVHGPNTINKSRMGIILEGLKLKDDGKIEIIGPDSLPGVTQPLGPSGEEIPLVKGPLVDYMYVVDEEDFFDGEHIVEEGRHGNWIWVILEGVVEIAKETSSGTLPIIRLGSGCFIGSLATFLVHGNIRAASVVAVGNVQLGVLDSQRLAQEYAGLPRAFRHLLVSLDRRLKATTTRVIGVAADSTTGADDWVITFSGQYDQVLGMVPNNTDSSPPASTQVAANHAQRINLTNVTGLFPLDVDDDGNGANTVAIDLPQRAQSRQRFLAANNANNTKVKKLIMFAGKNITD